MAVGSAGTKQKAEPTLRLIIAYKLARAGAALVASALLAVFTATGHTGSLHEIAKGLRHQATSAWSIELADAVVRAVMPVHLWIAVAALALDGTFSFIEGWSLERGWWWGPWLVVAATMAFVPFEVLALLRRAAVGRVVLLVVNLLVALYLARRALRKGKRASASPRA